MDPQDPENREIVPRDPYPERMEGRAEYSDPVLRILFDQFRGATAENAQALRELRSDSAHAMDALRRHVDDRFDQQTTAADKAAHLALETRAEARKLMVQLIIGLGGVFVTGAFGVLIALITGGSG